MNIELKLKSFLDNFSNNATSWKEATDEIRDLSKMSREYLLELDGIAVKPINFRNISTPSKWNTIGKKSIYSNINKMSQSAKNQFLNAFNSMF